MVNILKNYVYANFTDEGIVLTQKITNDELLLHLLQDKRDLIVGDEELRDRIQQLYIDIISYNSNIDK